uniref:Putative secreted protein n=1 Tax=Anopheles darlingi TaxID=43151 RepID=A0A2M4D4C8_ANODA
MLQQTLLLFRWLCGAGQQRVRAIAGSNRCGIGVHVHTSCIHLFVHWITKVNLIIFVHKGRPFVRIAQVHRVRNLHIIR